MNYKLKNRVMKIYTFEEIWNAKEPKKNKVMDLKGLFIKIDINNLLEVTAYFDAICGITSKNFTGVGMLGCVQRNHFPYLGTFDGEKLSFTTKVEESKGEQIITLEQLKKIKLWMNQN